MHSILQAFLLLALAPTASQDENSGRSIEIHPAPPVPPAVISRDENGRVTLRATRIAEPLILDGKLDESVYSQVPAASDFVQQEPHEGEPATERTEAWVFFDDENIYVSARCWDSHPEKMVVNEMRRDNFNIFQNENVTLVFDTFYDRRNGFFFQTNPLGALRDQAVGDEGQVNNQDWNTVWDSKASIFDQGWIVEIEIPFKSLRYREGRDQVWSFNLRRSIRHKNEETFLSPVAASHRFRGIYKFSEAATLVGIEAPVGARSLEMKPYGIATAVTNRTLDPPQNNDLDADAGVDVKYGLTPGLIADFTYNTDFAQVEEDQEQV
ncbi:MAG TPA: carbohydrate binding family 9 domain-containing protein, partial [Vicinamibacteria bacterium]